MKLVRLVIGEEVPTSHCVLVYRTEDYSFDVEPHPPDGVTSLQVNELQLELDLDGRLLYAWGYCPYQAWQLTNEYPRQYVQRTVKAVLDEKLIPGVSIGVNLTGRWGIFVNAKKGWVCVGDPDASEEGLSMIEFAPDSIVALRNDELVSIWLHPKSLPKHLLSS